MRISRKKRPQKPLIPHYAVNEKIRSEEVRLIDANGNNLGVFSLRDATAKAKEEELDLVIVNPKAEPPVAQILEFTAFKYQKEKEARKQKVNSHVSELKGIRLSVRIGAHDLDIRKKQSEKFLNQGDKVKAEIILRGRENTRPELAFDTLNKFRAMLEADVPLRLEQEPTKQGNKVTAIYVKR